MAGRDSAKSSGFQEFQFTFISEGFIFGKKKKRYLSITDRIFMNMMNSLQSVCKKEAQAVKELVAKVYFFMCMENILRVIFSISKEIYFFQIHFQLVSKSKIKCLMLDTVLEGIRFRYLLFHEMNVEFFALLLFVNILRPPQSLIFLNDTFLEKLDGDKCY